MSLSGVSVGGREGHTFRQTNSADADDLANDGPKQVMPCFHPVRMFGAKNDAFMLRGIVDRIGRSYLSWMQLFAFLAPGLNARLDQCTVNQLSHNLRSLSYRNWKLTMQNNSVFFKHGTSK